MMSWTCIVVAGAANTPVRVGADPAWVHKPPYPAGFHGVKREEIKKENRGGNEEEEGVEGRRRDMEHP